MLHPACILTVAALTLAGGGEAYGQPSLGNARTVLAAVVGAQGRPVVDVGLDDFVVTEGGAARDILDVHVADYPLAIVLDDRPELAPSLSAVRAAARRFIQRVGERPVALLRLSAGGKALASLDDERAVVMERLGALTSAGTDDSAPLDTIARAASILKESGAPFSGVIVVAAGPIDATALVRGDLLPQIIVSGAAGHVVRAQPPDSSQSPESAPTDLLRLIADQTHGQFTSIFSTASYDAALDRLVDRLAIEMMIQYMAPEGPRVGDVRVGVRLPGARVVGLGVK